MERFRFYMIILMFICIVTSCRNNDDYSVEIPISNINLLKPIKEAMIDLNDMSINEYIFRWDDYQEADYSFVLSKSEMLTDPVYFDVGDENFLSISAEELDLVASNFGFGNGIVGTLYWSVKPNNHIGIASKEIRSINVKRLVSRLLAPDNQKMIQLDRDMPETIVSFAWDTEGEDPSNTYSLVFSENKEMTEDIVAIDVGAANSSGVTYNQLQDVFIKYAEHPFKTKRVFWNVKRNHDNTMLARGSIALDIEPMLIFKDVRGSETITYKVAKIVYDDGKQQYWLAENLRTQKYPDGSDIESDNVMFAPENTFNSDEVTAFGGYYRPNPTMFNKLPSEGWRMPTINEYRALYEAAEIQEGTYNVLRSPDFYNYEPTKNDSKVNKWQLGLITSGQQQDETKVITNTSYCYMMAQGIGEDIHRAAMLDHFAIWEVWSVGANVRLIYND